MIRALLQLTDDLTLPVRVGERAENDLLKQVGRDPTGTREGEQHATGPQELKRKQVDILVCSRSALNLAPRMGKLWRIEHDYVEAPFFSAVGTQNAEDISFHVVCRLSVDVPIERQVLPRQLERWS
jgi:hypothetical protein